MDGVFCEIIWGLGRERNTAKHDQMQPEEACAAPKPLQKAPFRIQSIVRRNSRIMEDNRETLQQENCSRNCICGSMDGPRNEQCRSTRQYNSGGHFIGDGSPHFVINKFWAETYFTQRIHNYISRIKTLQLKRGDYSLEH